MNAAQALDSEPARPLALIVDDSPFLAAHLSCLLLTLGVEARVPAHSAELRTLAPRAAVIFVELELFHASGFEVMRAMAPDCSCPMVLLTGTGRKTDRQWALRAGARAVLTRPVKAEALRRTLEQLGCGSAQA